MQEWILSTPAVRELDDRLRPAVCLSGDTASTVGLTADCAGVDLSTPAVRELDDRLRPAVCLSDDTASTVGRTADGAGAEFFTPTDRVLVDRLRPAANTSGISVSTVGRTADGAGVDLVTPANRVLVDRPRPAANTSGVSVSTVGRLVGATCKPTGHFIGGVKQNTLTTRNLTDRPRPAVGDSVVWANTVSRLDGVTCGPIGHTSKLATPATRKFVDRLRPAAEVSGASASTTVRLSEAVCRPTGHGSAASSGVRSTAVSRREELQSSKSDLNTPDIGSDSWFENLVVKLRPLIASVVADRPSERQSVTITPQHTPPRDPASAGPVGPPTAAEPMHCEQTPSVSVFEELPPRGTELPQSLLDRVAGIFISHIGYDDVRETTAVRPGSHLNLTNMARDKKDPPCMPVDEQCLHRVEMLAAQKTWTSYPVAQERLFKFPEDKWEALFRSPSISEDTWDRVRAEQGLASGTFRDPLRKRIENDWAQADLVGRAGLKFSSVFMLCAEALMRAHQQLPEDDNRFTKQEVAALLYLQDPLSRLIFDQFARVTLKAKQVRRGNLLDVFAWPSAEARSHLENLPVFGGDLFANKFFSKLSEEVERFQNAAYASFVTTSDPVPASLPHQRGHSLTHTEGTKTGGKAQRVVTSGREGRSSAGTSQEGRWAQVTGVKGKGKGSSKYFMPYARQLQRTQSSHTADPCHPPPHRACSGGGGDYRGSRTPGSSSARIAGWSRSFPRAIAWNSPRHHQP